VNLRLRLAAAEDLPAILALLRDDPIGRGRETEDPAAYRRAFNAIAASPNDFLFLAVDGEDVVVGCFQLTVIPGLSRQGATRGQIESVRVAEDRRSQGVGAAMMALAEAEARRRGCALMQFTTAVDRIDAHRFYAQLGYAPSHVGMKKKIINSSS